MTVPTIGVPKYSGTSHRKVFHSKSLGTLRNDSPEFSSKAYKASYSWSHRTLPKAIFKASVYSWLEAITTRSLEREKPTSIRNPHKLKPQMRITVAARNRVFPSKAEILRPVLPRSANPP